MLAMCRKELLHLCSKTTFVCFSHQIFFLCLTEVCSAAGGDCTVGCINSKFNTAET